MVNKQYYIYIRSTNEQIPVTKEEFDAYYKDINLYRQRKQYYGRCVCPRSKFLMCDMDCYICPFRRNGDDLSLNHLISDHEGELTELIDLLSDSSPDLDDFIADTYVMTELMKRLTELMPEAVTIGELRQEGFSDEAIAKEIGIGRKTYIYRLKKLKAMLEKEFPEIFWKKFF